MNDNSSNGFNYTYSAKEKEEIKKIREKYIPDSKKEEDKITRIKRLDASALGAAQAWSLVFGVIGALILGFGMSLCMSDLSSVLGMSHRVAMLVGILVGFLGGALVSFAYPIYNFTLKRKREKIAPEIIRLSDELLEKYK